MKTYMVRSYIAVEISIDADSAIEAIDLASEKIQETLCPTFCYDYMEQARVYDEDDEEIDADDEELEAAE
jgi:hypothetical protein